MRDNIFTLFVGVFVCLALVFGCGGKKGSNEPQVESAGPVTVDATPVAAETVEVNPEASETVMDVVVDPNSQMSLDATPVAPAPVPAPAVPAPAK